MGCSKVVVVEEDLPDDIMAEAAPFDLLEPEGGALVSCCSCLRGALLGTGESATALLVLVVDTMATEGVGLDFGGSSSVRLLDKDEGVWESVRCLFCCFEDTES